MKYAFFCWLLIFVIPIAHAGDTNLSTAEPSLEARNTVFTVLQEQHGLSNYHLFYPLDDKDALSMRLVNIWCYENLMLYRKEMKKQHKKQSATLKKSKLLLESAAYGPSGNFVSLFKKNITDLERKEWWSYQRCALNQRGTFDNETMLGGVLTCGDYHLKRCKSTQYPAFSTLINGRHVDLSNDIEKRGYDLFIINRPFYKQRWAITIPEGLQKVDWQLEKLTLYGHTHQGEITKDIPWHVEIFPDGYRSLQFETCNLQYQSVSPYMQKVFENPLIIAAKQKTLLKKDHLITFARWEAKEIKRYPLSTDNADFQFFENYFHKIIENTTNLSIITRSDRQLWDALHYAAAQDDARRFLHDPHIIANYCIALRGLKQKAMRGVYEADYSTAINKQYENMLWILALKTRIKNDAHASVYVTALGQLLEVPTNCEADRTQEPNCWARPGYKFWLLPRR